MGGGGLLVLRIALLCCQKVGVFLNLHPAAHKAPLLSSIASEGGPLAIPLPLHLTTITHARTHTHTHVIKQWGKQLGVRRVHMLADGEGALHCRLGEL